MQKSSIETFIQKYTLGGAINSVTLDSTNGSLSVSGVTSDMQAMAFVKSDKLSLSSGRYSIYDTSQLRSLLGVFGQSDDINVNVETSQDVPVALQIDDHPFNTKVKFVLSDPQVIPDAPTITTLPDFNLTIPFDEEFMSRFVKATSALSEVDTFTIISGTQQADGHTSNADTTLVIGYTDMNTTRISLGVESFGGLEKKLTFSARYLKDIFLANKGAKAGNIEVSNGGLLSIKFDDGGFVSEYYLVKISNIVI
jgi:hypothetical protein